MQRASKLCSARNLSRWHIHNKNRPAMAHFIATLTKKCPVWHMKGVAAGPWGGMWKTCPALTCAFKTSVHEWAMTGTHHVPLHRIFCNNRLSMCHSGAVFFRVFRTQPRVMGSEACLTMIVFAKIDAFLNAETINQNETRERTSVSSASAIRAKSSIPTLTRPVSMRQICDLLLPIMRASLL